MIYTKIREKLNEIFRKRKTHTHAWMCWVWKQEMVQKAFECSNHSNYVCTHIWSYGTVNWLGLRDYGLVYHAKVSSFCLGINEMKWNETMRLFPAVVSECYVASLFLFFTLPFSFYYLSPWSLQQRQQTIHVVYCIARSPEKLHTVNFYVQKNEMEWMVSIVVICYPLLLSSMF